MPAARSARSPVARTPVLLLLLAGTCGSLGLGPCATFAPPIRGLQYGAPARLSEGQVELGGTVGPLVGGPHVGIGLRDWVSLEAGGNFALSDWAIGWLGPRFSYAPDRHAPVHFAADLELGAGIGAGGELDGNKKPGDYTCVGCDGRDWSDRLAFGGYLGFGVGMYYHWFRFFLRGRLEESTGTNVPFTVWPSLALHGEFAIGRHVALDVGGGLIAWANQHESATLGFGQVAFTILFDAVPPRSAAFSTPR